MRDCATETPSVLKRCMWGVGKALVVFFATAALLLTALLGVALIPRAAIAHHMLESAEYLCQDEMFFQVVDGVAGSKIDRYADAILLGIAWQYDAQDPLRSVMASSYYHEPTGHENRGLRETVANNLPANQEYSRYWHGSIALVRPLLTLLPIQGIYWLNAAVMLLLAGALLVRLWRRRAWVPLVGSMVALVGTSFWFVPLSLEYTWTPLVMLVQLHVVLSKRSLRSTEGRALFFLLSGMVTSYLDFLTTELLTLLVPLALMLWQDQDEGKEPPTVGRTAIMAASWFCGYAGMWALKWILAQFVLGSDFQGTVGQHISMRSGSLRASTKSEQLCEALVRNVSCLFPLEYGTGATMAAVAVVVCAVVFAVTHRRRRMRARMIACYGIIGLIPFVRFLVLNNHAFIHYFFTYRVLAATLFVAVLMLGELTDKELFHVPSLGTNRSRDSSGTQ